MHYQIVRYILGMVMKVEAVLLLLPFLAGLVYREPQAFSFLIMAIVSAAAAFAMTFKKPAKFVFYPREAIVSVSLSWILISIVGALPFVINGDIPSFTNALFETISGFTTTGASILEDVEALSHASLFWRSFTHWIGGMGVIVFMLAIVPMTGGYNAQLMRAESPGPTFGKLVPKVKESAKILYLIYFGMTLVQIVLLLIAILTIFMILFGVNFNAYYYLYLGKDKKQAFEMEEVRWYLIIIAISTMLIAVNVRSYFSSAFEAFHHAFFQVGSIITTTGYSTVDFDVWPTLSKGILVLLMFIGACAGSTGGGLKVSRVIILWKSVRQQVSQYLHPKSVSVIKVDSHTQEKSVVTGVLVYFALYAFLFVGSMFVLMLDGRQDLLTDFTAVTATFNNIGPGLAGVGPAKNFNALSVLSKYTLMFDMLAGRLELYPMLMLFVPSVWKKH